MTHPTARQILEHIIGQFNDLNRPWDDVKLYWDLGRGRVKIVAYEQKGIEASSAIFEITMPSWPGMFTENVEGKVINIGVLEDLKVHYLCIELAARRAKVPCKTFWYQDFEECYEGLEKDRIDVLIADRVIETYGSEEDLLLDGHIDRIKSMFSGPVILSSNAATPKRFQHYFLSILRSKTVKDLNPILDLIFEKDRLES